MKELKDMLFKIHESAFKAGQLSPTMEKMLSGFDEFDESVSLVNRTVDKIQNSNKKTDALYNACGKAVEDFADKQISEASEHNRPISRSDAKGYATEISDNESVYKALDALIEQIIEDKYDDMIDGKLSEEASVRSIDETETFNRTNKL